MWFTNNTNNTIGRITTAGAVTNYTDPSINGPTGSRPAPTAPCGSRTSATTPSGASPPGPPFSHHEHSAPFEWGDAVWIDHLDASASNATSVEFRLFGGIYGYNAPVICTATLTYYGWLCSWNTTTVPNGSYDLLSEAFGSGGSTFSSGVSITVNNPPPTTSVLIPSKGATLSGSTSLDASASNATSVEFRLFGGIYGYTAP